jgi:general L-amino acid transport system permease protein
LAAIAAQAAVLAAVATVLSIIVVTTLANLRSRGIPLGFAFLFDPANFSIAESVVPFDASETVLKAIWVGIANTLFVSFFVMGASTVGGLFLGLARMSPNTLLRSLARVLLEGMRNAPPILTLIFIYSLWWQAMPTDHAIVAGPGVLASIRGVATPALATPWSGQSLLALAVIGVVAIAFCSRPFGVLDRLSPVARGLGATGVLVVAAAALWREPKFALLLPEAVGADIRGGAVLTPELFTILFGLTLYTSAFVAEIIRGGIEAVPRGQWEAARALGLNPATVLSRVVLPQTLRVIVPPMTSQYINVVKNSTLALAVGYTEFLTVMGTIINKTSHAVEGTVVIIVVYLAINLSMSGVLNAYNRHLIERGR